MVNKVYGFETELQGGEVDQIVDELTVPSDTSIDIQELWFADVANVAYSLRINEVRLINNLPGSVAPTRDDRLVYDASLDTGDTIQIQASETGDQAASPAAYIVVEETD